MARFILPLLLVLAAFAAALTPVLQKSVEHWFRHDVELRAELAFNSMRDSVVRRTALGDYAGVADLFRQAAEDERLMAVALCGEGGALLAASGPLPKSASCPAQAGQSEGLTSGSVHVAVFPLSMEDGRTASFMAVHDLSFIARRGHDLRISLFVVLALLGVCASAVTILVARFTLRGWVKSLHEGLRAGGARQGSAAPDVEMLPIIRGLKQRLRDLDIDRRTSHEHRIQWTPQTLRQLLRNDLPGDEVLVVSNREPYIHNRIDGKVQLQIPASGLVSALEPVIRACSGTWIAHGSGSADKETVDSHDRIQVPPGKPAYTLRRIWLSDEEQEGYYFGLANEGLWPLCHLAYMRPTFRDADWAMYRKVNQKFADAVVAEAKTAHPIVLIQDYHFALLPAMVRERLPNATIITFWHIPWPNAEAFAICPWRDEVLAGLLGSSIIGFHTQFHCNNFFEAADRFLECRIDREYSTITVGGRSTLIRPYPISVEWPPGPLQRLPPAPLCEQAVRERFNLASDIRIGVGVERFDYTKGIADRFRAIGVLMERFPEWRGKFTFIQVAAPTRSKLDAYRIVQEEALAAAEEVNQRFGSDVWKPIIVEHRHHEPDEVFELFRSADLCVVSSLHDGMNLVAKEFVASRDDEKGVLILSTFAGASRELLEAEIVNPYDSAGTAQALNAALLMPEDEQRERMSLMREMVGENNVYRWAGRMLQDAARLRKRSHLVGQFDGTGK